MLPGCARSRSVRLPLRAAPGATRRDACFLQVMHDSRADCEALWYLHRIRETGVWDTQVGHGVAQLMAGLGNAPAGTPGRKGMNAVLEASRG